MLTSVPSSRTSADVNSPRLILFVVLQFLALTTPADVKRPQNRPFAAAPPRRVEVANINGRLGYNVLARNRELEDHVKEYIDRLSRIGRELKMRKSPAEIIDSIIQLAELAEDIAESQKERDIPATLRKILNMREKNVKELTKEARRKLMAPLSKQFDILLHDLKKLKASGINKVYQKRVQVLEKDLKSIKHDLLRLKSSHGLTLVKNKLEKVLEEMDELKTAAEDGNLANQARKDGKRLFSVVSYYMERYSVWMVPKIEMPTTLDYHNIEM